MSWLIQLHRKYNHFQLKTNNSVHKLSKIESGERLVKNYIARLNKNRVRMKKILTLCK